MEWWSGWFDHWGEEHLTRNQRADQIAERLADFLQRGISVNFYMFHGKCEGDGLVVYAILPENSFEVFKNGHAS